jgi:divalent metal cation (Fe/Co/Zn/Cd) transporter
MANSIALVGFGLDSVVESLSGLVLIWRLKKHGTISAGEEEEIEEKASRFVGITFFVLGAYVLFESVRKILAGDMAEPSLLGIAIAVLSLVVMPVLAYRKYKLGKELGLRSLVADSKETLACSFLSLALLAGMVSTYFFDFQIADPVVGLVIVAFLFREGYELVFENEEEGVG